MKALAGILAAIAVFLLFPAAGHPFSIDGEDGSAVSAGPIKAAFDRACDTPRYGTLLVLPKVVEHNDRGNVVLISLPAGVRRSDVERVMVRENAGSEGLKSVKSVSVLAKGGVVLPAEGVSAIYKCSVRETEPGILSFQCDTEVAGPGFATADPVRIAVRVGPKPEGNTEVAGNGTDESPVLLSSCAVVTDKKGANGKPGRSR